MDPLKGKRPTTITARQLEIVRYHASFEVKEGKRAFRQRLGLTAQEYDAELRQGLYCASVALGTLEQHCIHLVTLSSVRNMALSYLNFLPTMDDPLF